MTAVAIAERPFSGGKESARFDRRRCARRSQNATSSKWSILLLKRRGHGRVALCCIQEPFLVLGLATASGWRQDQGEVVVVAVVIICAIITVAVVVAVIIGTSTSVKATVIETVLNVVVVP